MIGVGIMIIGVLTALLGEVRNDGHFYSNTTITPFLFVIGVIAITIEIIIKMRSNNAYTAKQQKEND